MRMLKFRALGVDGQWKYGSMVAPRAKDRDHTFSPQRFFQYLREGQMNLDTLGEYIGIKDKNGKDVYESDIIIFDNSQIGGKRITGEVIFNTDQTLSNLEWGIWTKDGYHPTDFLGEIEIIGNIYQNPELK